MRFEGRYAFAAKFGSYLLLLGGVVTLVGWVGEIWFSIPFGPLLPPGTPYQYIVEYIIFLPVGVIILAIYGIKSNEWPWLVIQGTLALGASLALCYFFLTIPLFTLLPLIGSLVSLIGSLQCVVFGVLRKPY